MELGNRLKAMRDLGSGPSNVTMTSFYREVLFYAKLNQIAVEYQNHHGTASLLVCIVGLVINVYFISLLTVPMFRTALNVLLCGIAFCNVTLMLFYSIYAVHFYIYKPEDACVPWFWSYSWAVFTMIHAHSSIALYGTTVYISVYLGIMRVHMLRNVVMVEWQRRVICKYIAGIFLAVMVLCIPNWVSTSIRELQKCGENMEEQYAVKSSPLAKSFPALPVVGLWIHGLCLQLLPCVILFATIVSLMYYLRKVQKRRAVMLDKQTRHNNSVTISLVIILILFLVTQIPQWLLNFWKASVSQSFKQHILHRLGDMCDFLSLINNCISFPVYVISNPQYRRCIRTQLSRRRKRARDNTISFRYRNSSDKRLASAVTFNSLPEKNSSGCTNEVSRC